YHLINSDEELVDYSRKRKVDLVSPNTFVAFLRHVLRWTQEQRIAENLNQVLTDLKALHTEGGKFGDQLDLLNKHVTNAKTAVDTASSQYQKLQGKINQVAKLETNQTKKLQPVAEGRENLEG
ncbi:DNA recombination protein RmuC, partial [Candidatus Berkelbacteria bacterium]|nr:DNA recombination protein RmuC [Candidatus Berkelbacteria bacterium]